MYSKELLSIFVFFIVIFGLPSFSLNFRGRIAEYGGLGLDYSFSVAVGEELGSIRCGSIPMAIGVQTDMATPALAR